MCHRWLALVALSLFVAGVLLLTQRSAAHRRLQQSSHNVSVPSLAQAAFPLFSPNGTPSSTAFVESRVFAKLTEPLYQALASRTYSWHTSHPGHEVAGWYEQPAGHNGWVCNQAIGEHTSPDIVTLWMSCQRGDVVDELNLVGRTGPDTTIAVTEPRPQANRQFAAIPMSPSDSWATYTSNTMRFSLKYPLTMHVTAYAGAVLFAPQGSFPAGDAGLIIEARDIHASELAAAPALVRTTINGNPALQGAYSSLREDEAWVFSPDGSDVVLAKFTTPADVSSQARLFAQFQAMLQSIRVW